VKILQKVLGGGLLFLTHAVYLYFTKSMVVIVRIEQTNKQTDRQISTQTIFTNVLFSTDLQSSKPAEYIRYGVLG